MKNTTKLILILWVGLSSAVINAQTVTFNYTGALQTWTVPGCVSQITITAYGAQGGGSDGGLGGEAIATIPVAGGAILDVYVGGNPAAQIGPGGYNGGGASTVDPCGGPPDDGYPGGGASDVRITPYALANRIIVAGGGGGQGWDPGAGGSGGGLAGGAGAASWIAGTPQGQGGTQVGGGAGGTYNSDSPAGVSGSLGQGGAADAYTGLCSGGGGGGGYYGGGGGFVDPGGGGSSYIGYPGSSNTSTIAGVRSGNGQVIITWAVSTPPILTASAVSNVGCNGASTGSAHGTVTGGSAPFTYLWTPSAQTNATATGLTAGTYTIALSDACGNTASASVAITQPTALVATATTTTNVTCNAGSTGATGSTVTGGTTPYTYSWTGGSTNATATGLTAGSYTLSITDKNGCSATATTVVTQPNVLSDSAFAIKNVLCNGGSTGSASSIVNGGTMPYTYLWTPGGSTKDTASGLSAGTFTVTVSDACGASASASIGITQPAALSITSHSTLDDGHNSGTAAIRVSGGTSPYTYLWSPGGNTSDSISGEHWGTYCCNITDAHGCKDSTCVFITHATGIDGINDNSALIVVYPNPNNGQFTIESSVGGASSVEIYNVLGEKVFTRDLSTIKGANTININNQPNGVYLYRVISDSGDLLGEGKITLQK